MTSWDELRDRLHTDNHELWLLIGLCVAVIATMEAVQEAVEGAWPHQRRVARMEVGEQRAQSVWAVVALLVLPAALLAVGNVGMIVWKDVARSDEMTTGGALLGIGWVLFILASVDRLRLRRLIARAGPVFPIALVAVLVAAIALLLSAFLEVRPSVDTIRDAIPLLREDS
jgi:uncharacterized BrkB/YihY/UPF0761 family membrane protein